MNNKVNNTKISVKATYGWSDDNWFTLIILSMVVAFIVACLVNETICHYSADFNTTVLTISLILILAFGILPVSLCFIASTIIVREHYLVKELEQWHPDDLRDLRTRIDSLIGEMENKEDEK